jgi:phosphoglycerate dehydrogenase-like enzyme
VIAGAALDVTDPEPLLPDDPLWMAPNVLISPHVAGYGSQRSFDRLVELAVDNVLRFSRGDVLLNTWEEHMSRTDLPEAGTKCV